MIDRVYRNAMRFIADQSASPAIEYALMAAVVAITCISALMSFGSESNGMWQGTGDALVGAMQSTRG